jgi:serine protease AprX
VNRTIASGLILAVIGCILTYGSKSYATDEKVSPHLQQIIDGLADTGAVKVWIYFTDKDSSPAELQEVAAAFSERARARRRGRPPDWYDLPVSQAYIDGIERIVGQKVHASRWLNAVSARMTADQIQQATDLPFVAKVDLVHIFYRPLLPQPEKAPAGPVFDSLEYGTSYTQNHQIATDSLHKVGLNGAGMLVAFLDTGFKIDHPAFDSLTIIDTWDFINDNAIVDDEVAEGQTDHGTATLSACGGFSQDTLIGPAYKAQYALYETEILNQEIQVEEDYWLFASERADSVGADIISSSLGYTKWYTYADMDGHTAVTTIAADIAASRGILVVVSAGNEGAASWHYIGAPADADSIIAVGAIDRTGTITTFSSFGPTYDGRIKPELVALGELTSCADILDSYTYKSGTSLSAPLIAGAAALVLQANPAMKGNPMAIRQRLLESGDRYLNPNNRYGYGLPNSALAAGYGLKIFPIPSVTLGNREDTTLTVIIVSPPGEAIDFDLSGLPLGSQFTDNGNGTFDLTLYGDATTPGTNQYYLAATVGEYADTARFEVTTQIIPEAIRVGPNPFRDSLFVRFGVSTLSGFKIEVFSLSGELVYSAHSSENPFLWSGTNESGAKVASGAYIIRISADGIEEKIKVLKL